MDKKHFSKDIFKISSFLFQILLPQDYEKKNIYRKPLLCRAEKYLVVMIKYPY